jgi:hypothetical protein
METARGDRAGALRVFEEGYETAQSAPDAAVRSQFLFNYARTLEQSGGAGARNPASLYREAFVADPRMREAAEAGFTLSIKENKVAEAAGFANMLIDKGHYSTAENGLRSALDLRDVVTGEQAGSLFVSIMKLLVVTGVCREMGIAGRPGGLASKCSGGARPHKARIRRRASPGWRTQGRRACVVARAEA